MRFSRRVLVLPYLLFMFLFVVLPLIIVLYYAFTDGGGNPTTENFVAFFTNPKTIGTFVYSVVIAAVTTACCLLLAFPCAFVLAKGAFSGRGVLLLLVVLPMWINFTLRITALKEVLDFVEGNLAYHPFLNTIIGQVYDFLPFMVLPIHTSLTKMDPQLLEAARDLGADRRAVFFKVLLPLAFPGIVSGITMVFLPAMTNYVVLDMLYNSTFIMGSLIGSYFSSFDWHNGSMISAVLLTFIMIIAYMASHATEREAEKESVL